MITQIAKPLDLGSLTELHTLYLPSGTAQPQLWMRLRPAYCLETSSSLVRSPPRLSRCFSDWMTPSIWNGLFSISQTILRQSGPKLGTSVSFHFRPVFFPVRETCFLYFPFSLSLSSSARIIDLFFGTRLLEDQGVYEFLPKPVLPCLKVGRGPSSLERDEGHRRDCHERGRKTEKTCG